MPPKKLPKHTGRGNQQILARKQDNAFTVYLVKKGTFLVDLPVAGSDTVMRITVINEPSEHPHRLPTNPLSPIQTSFERSPSPTSPPLRPSYSPVPTSEPDCELEMAMPTLSPVATNVAPGGCAGSAPPYRPLSAGSDQRVHPWGPGAPPEPVAGANDLNKSNNRRTASPAASDAHGSNDTADSDDDFTIDWDGLKDDIEKHCGQWEEGPREEVA
ncbi:hypothetical protein BV25DRAFT_1919498 [Artomyces pyxidatus]|uniref:Uncharacterized protein n=1 Tax=Artomyces pyxidatus TaxID=48021 RepID=A0ACB8SQ33_9AGAM|nr:hypothetical protein BV25DRAFT_1919498 [Artomyces pyxidatus]